MSEVEMRIIALDKLADEISCAIMDKDFFRAGVLSDTYVERLMEHVSLMFHGNSYILGCVAGVLYIYVDYVSEVFPEVSDLVNEIRYRDHMAVCVDVNGGATSDKQ